MEIEPCFLACHDSDLCFASHISLRIVICMSVACSRGFSERLYHVGVFSLKSLTMVKLSTPCCPCTTLGAFSPEAGRGDWYGIVAWLRRGGEFSEGVVLRSTLACPWMW